MEDNGSAAGAAPIDPAAIAAAATGALSFPVFRDVNGERFVFPGFYASEERPYDWGRARHICVALHLEEEKDRLVVVPERDGSLTFPHVEASAGHRGFAHGSSDVWLIGGPTFDAVSRAALSKAGV